MSTSHRFPEAQTGAPTRKPEWLRVQAPAGRTYEAVKAILEKFRLKTVCQEAICPNRGECWGAGTATVMLMGDVCTRACRFCNVQTGHPAPLDDNEPMHLARAVSELGLHYLVLTSVDRDDLADGGAGHFARTITALKAACPDLLVEVLIPDFQGSALAEVAEARPHVIGHNLETVARLQGAVRDRRAGYEKSLSVLAHIKSWPGIYTKSSLMLGLGETEDELLECFRELRAIGVDVLTLGQYLQPSRFHLKVERFYTPAEFEQLKEKALGLGFLYVASGPLVRSSYRAAEFFLQVHHGKSRNI